MDGAAFEVWRAEIGVLTAAQRGMAFFDLALAEANDPIEPLDDEIGEGAPRVESRERRRPRRRLPERRSSRRNSSRSCFRRSGATETPVLAVLAVAASRSEAGAARTACLGIAARPAGRRSRR